MNTTFAKAWSLFALALGVLVLAGTALAGNGGGNGGNDNGGAPPATPPGQEKKQEATPPPAPAPAAKSAPAQAKKAEAPKPEKKAEPKKAAPAKAAAAKVEAKKAAPKASPSDAKSASSASASSPAPKITICHRTGSDTNPWEQITISRNGLNGHDGHGDLIPAPAAGCPAGTSNDADKVKAGKDKDKVTICHATGSATNPYVVITIAQEGWDNGHSKHEGDINPVPAGGCPTTPPAQTDVQRVIKTQTPACPATGTRTETVVTGVLHATGSKTNPFVLIHPSEQSAHYGKHEDDRLVTETRTIVVSTGEVCASSTPVPVKTSSACPTTGTRTETVVLGVLHATGSKTNPFVLIHPSEQSAHYGKHEDDRLLTETRTIVVSTGATCSTTVTSAPTGGVAGATATTTSAGNAATTVNTNGVAGTAAQPTSAGGVAGATATLPQKKERGGVLGTARTLGETAVRGRLPFTGLPLWAVALAGAALLGTGLMLRRRGQLDRP